MAQSRAGRERLKLLQPIVSRPLMKVAYELSFEDYLESRYGPRRVPNDLANPPFIMPMVICLLVCVGFMAWSLLSALVIAFLVLVIGGTIHIRIRSRAMNHRLAELREDYESFSSGQHIFEADEKGWRLLSAHGDVHEVQIFEDHVNFCFGPRTSTHEEQAHSWDDVQTVQDLPNVLYLTTYSGACTLPKRAFNAEQLAQLKVWYESAMKSAQRSSGEMKAGPLTIR